MMLPQLAGLLLTLALVGAIDLGQNTRDALRDRVPTLPGYGPVTRFNLFAGYVTVDSAAKRELFYAFAESQRDADTDPLVLWLNGGPGCSSLGGGFMSELGPFYPTLKGTLVRNAWAWNRVANVLYLESPAFVGFSHSNRSSDIQTGDRATAQDARTFLLRWLDRFPQFKGRPFWIAGQSYGGHYVPNLAAAILDGNANLTASGAQAINLQGFLVGNAWTDPAVENKGAVDYWWSHGMVSDDAAEGMLSACDFATMPPVGRRRRLQGVTSGEEDGAYVSAGGLAPEAGASSRQRLLRQAGANASASADAARCDGFITQAVAEMGEVSIYDILTDLCLPSMKPAVQLGRMLRGHAAGLSSRPLAGGTDPCIEDAVAAYLNQKAVQVALHANVSGRVPGPWQYCSNTLQYSMEDLLTPMQPVYRRLMRSKLKILVYSGDVDAIVPLTGTRRWIKRLGLTVLEPWRPWKSSTQQPGGWTVKYRGLTYATVRGAGHSVPYGQPERAFSLFSRWVQGKAL